MVLESAEEQSEFLSSPRSGREDLSGSGVVWDTFLNFGFSIFDWGMDSRRFSTSSLTIDEGGMCGEGRDEMGSSG